MQFIQQLHSLMYKCPKYFFIHVFHTLKCVRSALAAVSLTSCQMAGFSSAFVVLASKKHKIHLSGTCQLENHRALLWRVY